MLVSGDTCVQAKNESASYKGMCNTHLVVYHVKCGSECN